MKIQIRQTSVSGSEAAIRGHRVAVDRPVEKGGGDAGPMGGELFLASIGGCFMSTLLAAIRARELEISGVGVEVVAEPVGTPPRFEKVEVWVSAVAPDRGALEKVVGIAAQGCIMVNTLRDKIELEVGVV